MCGVLSRTRRDRQAMTVWRDVFGSEAASLEGELARELRSDHPLFGRRARALARRTDCDDVAFEVEPGGLCVVHLTWTKESGVRWPRYEFVDRLPEVET